MKLSPTYLILGLLTMALLGFVEYRGMSPLSAVRASEPLPTSVRDNPGAYRSHYTRSAGYVGGK